jgi:predicted lipoprotein with Yx(FWY)xxD motif
MHLKIHSIVRPRRRGVRLGIAAVAVALCAGAIGPVVSGASTVAHHSAARGVEVEAHTGLYGSYLIVGSGPLKGFSLYAITSDTASHFYCNAVPWTGPGGSTFPCTGPETDQNAEWPALTTTAAPIAGPGVNASMLRSVYRTGIGHQVEYDGHPLYLFDQSPGEISGEGWDEPSFPPWHGSWWLVSPAGTFLESNQTLTASTLANGTTALSVIMIAGGGTYAFPVYSDSADTSMASNCENGCARIFEPVLTTGTPGIEGTAVTGTLGTITRPDGTTQVTYDGHPLYLYSDEGVTKVPGRGFTATGSGNDKTVGSGTFTLVTP